MIREMCPSHVPLVAQLEKRCFSDPWSEASLAAELENPLSLWLVWEEAGQVLGYVGAQSVAPEADVMNLAVDPAARKRHIASKLLAQLLQRLQATGIERLFLEVRTSNAPARALYEGFGFEQVGLRKKYYVNPVEDALILRKEIAPC